MRLMGALLLLGGAGLWCLLRRREGMLPVRVGRALLEDLAVFSYQIRVRRTPLPELLEEVLAQGLGAEYLWRPLAQAVEETREELTGFLREETARQASQGRINAALSMAGACLAILVLL